MSIQEFKLPESMRIDMKADDVFRAANPPSPQRLEPGGRVIESDEERETRIAWQKSMVAHRNQYRDSIAVRRNPSPAPGAATAASVTVAIATPVATKTAGPAPEIMALQAQVAAKTEELQRLVMETCAAQDRPFVQAWLANADGCQAEFPTFALYAAYRRHSR